MRIKLKTKAALAGISLAAVAAATLPTAMASASPAGPGTVTAASLPTITVKMTGKKITVGGALRSGGVRIVSTVTGEQQGEPIFVRLDPGVTLSQFFKVAPSAPADPNNLDGIASIVVDVQVNRGATSTVQADLAPGQYVALDVIGNGRPPLIPFTISKAAHPAALPAPSAVVAAIEFGFRGPATLHNGALVRFANHGFLVHMLVAARGATAAGALKIAQLLRAGKDGQAQRLATGFATFAGPLSHGAAQQLAVRVQPGWWVLACFMNTQDGREHTQLGMERVIHIVP
jgi:hypothetical protein